MSRNSRWGARGDQPRRVAPKPPVHPEETVAPEAQQQQPAVPMASLVRISVVDGNVELTAERRPASSPASTAAGAAVASKEIVVSTTGDGTSTVTTTGTGRSKPALRPGRTLVRVDTSAGASTAVPPTAPGVKFPTQRTGIADGGTSWFAPVEAVRGERMPDSGTHTRVEAVYDADTFKDTLMPFRSKVLAGGLDLSRPGLYDGLALWFQTGDDQYVQGVYVGHAIARGLAPQTSPLHLDDAPDLVYYLPGMHHAYGGAIVRVSQNHGSKYMVGQQEFSALPVDELGEPTVKPVLGTAWQQGTGYAFNPSQANLSEHLDAILARAAGAAAPTLR